MFFTCSPFFSLGLAISANVRKYRPLYVVISRRFVNLLVEFIPLCGVPPPGLEHYIRPNSNYMRSQVFQIVCCILKLYSWLNKMTILKFIFLLSKQQTNKYLNNPITLKYQFFIIQKLGNKKIKQHGLNLILTIMFVPYK